MDENSQITYSMLNSRLAQKQAELSKKRLLRPDMRRQRDEAKRFLAMTEGRIKNLIRAGNPDYTDNHAKDCLNENKEYIEIWARLIIKTADYDRLNIEIENLEQELDTLSEIGTNLSRESKLLGYGT